MKNFFYKLECITNLSVGSSDINYNIVDNQVEKDAINGLPIIHASGIKGALRDRLVSDQVNRDDITEIFGDQGDKNKTLPGTHKFFDAMLIARPMRVYGDDNLSSINVATVESINNFINMLKFLAPDKYNINPIGNIDFADNKFLTNIDGDIKIEFDKTGKLPKDISSELEKISGIIGEKFALAASFDDYDLPVIARNHLVNRISNNLWYEEVVPHGSIFFFVISVPDDCDKIINIPEIVQFGGNSSIGCGFSCVTKL